MTFQAECAPGPIRGAMVNSYVWVQCEYNYLDICPENRADPYCCSYLQLSVALSPMESSMVSSPTTPRPFGLFPSCYNSLLPSSRASWHLDFPNLLDGSSRRVGSKRLGRRYNSYEVARLDTMSSLR